MEVRVNNNLWKPRASPLRYPAVRGPIMTDETKTCQVEMRDGKVCGRQVLYPQHGDGMCVLHTEDEKKCPDTFQIELDKTLKDTETECYDFTLVVFPADGYTFPREFDKDVDFDHATFLGPAPFVRTRFRGIADFCNVVFHQEALFRYSHFDKRSDFLDATFEGRTDFAHRQFDGEADFNGVTFKSNVDFTKARFDGEAYFANCTFDKRASFFRAEFEKVGSFTGARFHGRTDFDEAEFGGECEFSASTFSGEASFTRTQFTRDVSFLKCHLTDTARLTFDAETRSGQLGEMFAAETESGQPGIMFEADADFTSMRLDDGCQLTFRKIILERCLFLETRVRDVLFIGVAWPRRQTLKRKWLYGISAYRRWVEPMKIFYREGVYDDLRNDPAWVRWNLPDSSTKPPDRSYYDSVAGLYRELQANYITNYDYPTAGAFYLGEQEMIRKSKHWTRRWFGTFVLYRLIAYYGESFILPFFWLIATLALFPIYLLCDGIYLYSPSHEVNYEWSWSLSDLFFLKADYWNAVGANLSLATFNRGAIASYLTEPYKHGIITLESAVLIVLISFLVMALRRAFKRKSF